MCSVIPAKYRSQLWGRCTTLLPAILVFRHSEKNLLEWQLLTGQDFFFSLSKKIRETGKKQIQAQLSCEFPHIQGCKHEKHLSTLNMKDKHRNFTCLQISPGENQSIWKLEAWINWPVTRKTLMDKQLNFHCTRFEFRLQFLSNLSLCKRGNKTMWITCSSLKSLVFVSFENCSGFFY